MTAGTISSAAFGDTTSCFTIMATARSPMSLATPASTTNKSDGEPDVPGSTTTATATLIFSSAITSSSIRSEEHTSELQSRLHLVCRLLLEKKKKQPHTLYCWCNSYSRLVFPDSDIFINSIVAVQR